MAITVCPCTSGLSTVLLALGSLTATPCCSIGVMSIMMMSSTSMTSTSGVTLISDLTPPLVLPRSIDIDDLLLPRPLCVLDEVVDELRRRVVHLDVEVLDARRQVVVDPSDRNRDDQTERGLDERFRNTLRHCAETGRAGRADALERGDDADDGAEQSDERGGRADRRERGHTLLEIGGRERRRALNRTADGVKQVF